MKRLAALIGETTALPVLDALRTIPDIQLFACWIADSSLKPLVQALHPAVKCLQNWDELLISGELDAVLVAGTTAEVVTASQQFVQRGVPLLVVTETQGDPSRLFEFTPLWQDRPEFVVPLFLSGIQAAATMAVREFATASRGDLWRLKFQRSLNAEQVQTDGISESLLDRLLLQDLKWICDLVGFPQHVTAMVSGPAERPSEVTLTLGGEQLPEVRWTIAADPGPEEWQLTLQGTQGEVVARCRNNHLPIVEIDGLSRPLSINETKVEDARQQLAEFAARRTGGEIPRWTEVIQLAEISAAARRSRRRRRTVDIHFEEVSERSQFKSQMTAIGCGALMWSLMGTIVMLVLAGLFDPRDREYRTSAAAKFVLSERDFNAGTSTFTPLGREDFQRIAERWSSTSPVLIVEQSTDESAATNAGRMETVVGRLREQEIRSPEQRVVLRSLAGKWFEAVLIVGWIVVFAPLGIVLALQLLLGVARGQQGVGTDSD